ncbi:hypothetical protein ACCAA_130085 [Candidatus Accumulibacter aalborgensis]|uniref:Uncharacterized protein n=1 Tax=Candidatus Accumulibacter aalborgensis TaxID=1860102 RepID=A0A1A8XIB6_9PROT|nr:hypothetical protein ACCAA_130085 [Candidatus Accumulibacter aalborgensis]
MQGADQTWSQWPKAVVSAFGALQIPAKASHTMSDTMLAACRAARTVFFDSPLEIQP